MEEAVLGRRNSKFDPEILERSGTPILQHIQLANVRMLWRSSILTVVQRHSPRGNHLVEDISLLPVLRLRRNQRKAIRDHSG